MLKKFNELVKLHLTKFTQKKPTFKKDIKTGLTQKLPEEFWLDYIEWAKVLELLYYNGAEKVQFHSEFCKEKQNTLIIHLLIDDNSYVMSYPIIDGNAIIKDANQMQIHKAELRGFVKCVAIHTGLGLSLWQKEERQLIDTVEKRNSVKTAKPKEKLSDERFNKARESICTGDFTKTELIEKFDLTAEQIKIIEKL